MECIEHNYGSIWKRSEVVKQPFLYLIGKIEFSLCSKNHSKLEPMMKYSENGNIKDQQTP